MNKIFLALVFASAMFLLGCSADIGGSSSGHSDHRHDWSKPGHGPGPGPGPGGTQYCHFNIPGMGPDCFEIEDADDILICSFIPGSSVSSAICTD
ncbi:MAG: hypothetical protein LBC85_10880 [Fibromonadaceae bacterium]|jgi:hypothetical protein|nr:hypothetical protein [Fibromonadaceae bacterium]